ncbi:hypothetical protein, partial [Aeromicrobium sp.]|uniref:hypothetical protein n=1 Tax=Aeromicrobium sp. TaxID=1871063 RepID=UPI0025C139A3
MNWTRRTEQLTVGEHIRPTAQRFQSAPGELWSSLRGVLFAAPQDGEVSVVSHVGAQPPSASWHEFLP